MPYVRGFIMQPGVMYICAGCGLRMHSDYERYIDSCPRCGQEFLGYVEPLENPLESIFVTPLAVQEAN